MVMKRSILFALVTFFALTPIVHAGFGVSPAKIIEDKLVKGSTFERVIYLVQGTPEKDLRVKLQVDDSDIKDWVTAIPEGDFIIPKGTQQFPVILRFAVPKDTKMGIYKGFVRASGAPKAEPNEPEGQSGVVIALGAAVGIELTVGEGVYYEYAIRNLDFKNIKETDDPTADISIENKGNVPAGPAEASFELFNKYGDVRLAYIQGVKVPKVEPFKIENMSVEFPISVGLSVGEYWGLVKLYDDSGGKVREFKGVFNVNKATFLDKFGRYIIWTSLAVVAFIIVRLLTLFVRKIRRKRT